MRNDAARDAFRGPEIKLLRTSDAMRDLVVTPAMGVSTLEPGVVWTREWLRRSWRQAMRVDWCDNKTKQL